MSPAKQVECLVIGGGLAGSMVAMRLASVGREVTLIEREPRAHHKVCGEFLSAEAVAYLRAAGMEPPAMGAATIRTVRLAAGRRVAEAALPFSAFSLSRSVLDQALLNRAAECGCNVRRGTAAESLIHGGDGWVARMRGGESVSAQSAFLATGKHDLNGHERQHRGSGDLVGFKLHWRLTPRQTDELRDAMDLFLFQGGYGGLSLIENATANLCLVVRRDALRARGGWPRLLAAIAEENVHLGSRLRGASALWDRPLAIYPIPYGYLATQSDGRPDDLWRVGDQAAVIPSFTGDGMSIALHSGALASEMFLAGRSAGEFHRSLRNQLRPGMRVSNLIAKVMMSGFGRSAAPAAATLLPEAMVGIARWTRIPERVMTVPAAS